MITKHSSLLGVFVLGVEKGLVGMGWDSLGEVKGEGLILSLFGAWS